MALIQRQVPDALGPRKGEESREDRRAEQRRGEQRREVGEGLRGRKKKTLGQSDTMRRSLQGHDRGLLGWLKG